MYILGVLRDSHISSLGLSINYLEGRGGKWVRNGYSWGSQMAHGVYRYTCFKPSFAFFRVAARVYGWVCTPNFFTDFFLPLSSAAPERGGKGALQSLYASGFATSIVP